MPAGSGARGWPRCSRTWPGFPGRRSTSISVTRPSTEPRARIGWPVGGSAASRAATRQSSATATSSTTSAPREDATLAARNALLNMIDHLGTRGYDPQQAYAICSCAVDLRMSQAVDVPNFTVSAFLPLDIFTSGAPPRCRDARCSPLNGVSTEREGDAIRSPGRPGGPTDDLVAARA
jgi:hypothetical protein